MRVRLNSLLFKVLAMCVCDSDSARNLCIGSLNDLAWYILGNSLKIFHVGSTGVIDGKYGEISLIFSPQKFCLYTRMQGNMCNVV